MTDYLVLQNAKASPRGQVIDFKAGDVIRDQDFTIADLKNSGVAVVAYDSSTMEDTVRGFLDVERVVQLESMLPIMTSDGVLPLEINSLTIGGTTTVTAILDEDDMISNRDDALSTQQAIKSYSDAPHLIMEEPDGFPNRTDSTMTFTDGTTRLFSIAPSGPPTSFDVWTDSVRRTYTNAQTVNWSDDEGLHYFYFDTNGDLQTTTDGAVAIQNAIVALIYWDTTNNVSIIRAEERHGLIMDGDTHRYLHEVFGTQWVEGLAIANLITGGSGTLDTSCQHSVTNGVIRDEDIRLSIVNGSPQTLSTVAQIPVYYLEGSTPVWRKKTADNFTLIHDGTAGFTSVSGRIAYNLDTAGTWSLAEVSTNFDYVLVHIFATNNINEPIISIAGQNEYATINDARLGATTELENLYTINLPVKEFTPIASLLAQTSSTFTNTPQAIYVDTAVGEQYVDWRGQQSFSSSGTSANKHSQLSELDQDDHLQYALLAGRAGGQTLIGGTGSGDNLIIQASSHATPGIIDIDGAVSINSSQASVDFKVSTEFTVSAIFLDSSTNRIGLFQGSPQANLDINGSILCNDIVTFTGDLSTSESANTTTGVTTLDDVSTNKISQLAFTGAGTITITGFANGRSGKHLTVMNYTGNNLTLNRLDSGSSSANQIETGTGGNVTIANNNARTLKYNASNSKWQLIN